MRAQREYEFQIDSSRSKGYRLPIVFRITARTFIYSNWILIRVSINATHVDSTSCAITGTGSWNAQAKSKKRFTLIRAHNQCHVQHHSETCPKMYHRFATRVDVDRISLTKVIWTKVGHCIQFSGSDRSGNISVQVPPIHLASLPISWNRWDWKEYTVPCVSFLHLFYSLLCLHFVG